VVDNREFVSIWGVAAAESAEKIRRTSFAKAAKSDWDEEQQNLEPRSSGVGLASPAPKNHAAAYDGNGMQREFSAGTAFSSMLARGPSVPKLRRGLRDVPFLDSTRSDMGRGPPETFAGARGGGYGAWNWGNCFGGWASRVYGRAGSSPAIVSSRRCRLSGEEVASIPEKQDEDGKVLLASRSQSAWPRPRRYPVDAPEALMVRQYARGLASLDCTRSYAQNTDSLKKRPAAAGECPSTNEASSKRNPEMGGPENVSRNLRHWAIQGDPAFTAYFL